MAILVPTAAQCWSVLGPIFSIGAVVWIWRNGDELVRRLFPHLEWERELGWLNLSAHRRAEEFLRWMRHAFYLVLLASLASALALGYEIGRRDPDSPNGLLGMAVLLVDFAAVLSPWIYYFVQILAPRINAEFEKEELERWREEHPETEPKSRQPQRGKITVWDSPPPRRF